MGGIACYISTGRHDEMLLFRQVVVVSVALAKLRERTKIISGDVTSAKEKSKNKTKQNRMVSVGKIQYLSLGKLHSRQIKKDLLI